MKKKIKSLLLIFSASSVLFSCGDAGIGFDVASELAIDGGTMLVPIPGTGIPTNINPESLSFDYNLSDVDGFSDAINDLNQTGARVYLLGIAYEFTGVNDSGDTYDESVPIEEVRMNFVTSGSTETIQIPLAGGTLQNTAKTDLDIAGVKSLIESELLSSQGMAISFDFDIGTITTPVSDEQVDFDLTVYFNVALRVRDINN